MVFMVVSRRPDFASVCVQSASVASRATATVLSLHDMKAHGCLM